MNSFEKIEQKIHDEGIKLDIINFDTKKIKGLYVGGSIALNQNLHTTAEKACVAAEELAHHELSVGNILNMEEVQNRKQEHASRLRAYNMQIGLFGIVRGFKARCQNRYELSELLGVTEDFLQEALDCYHSIYGISTNIDNYTILFEPGLAVLERF